MSGLLAQFHARNLPVTVLSSLFCTQVLFLCIRAHCVCEHAISSRLRAEVHMCEQQFNSWAQGLIPTLVREVTSSCIA